MSLTRHPEHDLEVIIYTKSKRLIYEDHSNPLISLYKEKILRDENKEQNYVETFIPMIVLDSGTHTAHKDLRIIYTSYTES